MKMKRFCSACIGAALALGMLATTAQATDMKSVLRRIRWESMVEVHDSERGWMCYNKWMFFFGFVAIENTDRSDISARNKPFDQIPFDHGDRRFSVGAGHAQNPHIPRRISVELLRDLVQHIEHIIDPDIH